jgi:23S rRNA maturation mini-RNase III
MTKVMTVILALALTVLALAFVASGIFELFLRRSLLGIGHIKGQPWAPEDLEKHAEAPLRGVLLLVCGAVIGAFARSAFRRAFG